MKSVLISIQPKWCELIASGKKTVEVRKTKPKIDVPFKCYIYCTKGDWLTSVNGKVQKPNNMVIDLSADSKIEELNGKVIGEFVCDEIAEYEGEFWDDETQEYIKKVIHSTDWDGYPEIDYDFIAENGEENSLCKSSCLTWEELRNYMGAGVNIFYAWHISDLVIYDKPKELSEFFYACNKPKGTDCSVCLDRRENKCKSITRPPQSWCYVEERSAG